MNAILFFLLEVTLTLVICALVVRYLRPYLNRVLVDLCGTEDRAQFWTVFSTILLVGLPVLIALAYKPEASGAEEIFFEIASRVSGNLIGFLLTLVGIGCFVTLFALVAPRRKESQ
jgi:tellurite resistance protein TehA-like permease